MKNFTPNSEIFGFAGNKDFVPDIFKPFCKEQVCQIFLTLYNANLGSAYQIPHKFSRNCTKIRQIFDKFIKFSLAKNSLNFKKTTKFCLTSNLIIYSFLQGKKAPLCASLPKLKVAKIIALLQNNGEFGINFDASSGFKNFVFDKISYKNKNCQISLNGEVIVIQRGEFRLGILPFFRQVGDTNGAGIQSDIALAISQNSHLNLDTLYLVYPRSEHFRRHIEVKSHSFAPDFTLKLVPYSINNKIFLKG
ncbi:MULTISPECIES: hypothetical protein [unclassified Campylobacter]|uniref:hypothetical protein n=1 Tax=unclassified Campylobacter TaxID=2593542 RepID=UPI0022E9E26F|nr:MULTISPECIES: hypothetical protein [unclassified Campylobacter]MDA3042436.1 hypothetical protein [Campylobacter sp. JMF_09 ED2]MDA3044750.1 hypothetical protein [Campylobacter sp. JMF_07 ED4]MDA3063128.1 hypothetical protein [Campylobacter sp. JMF_11 EL3]MDA3074209.1 hypothetical protein [Campylobacter sp. JMF_05 ED3]